MTLRRWGLFALPCSAAGDDGSEQTGDALSQDATLIPETAPTEAVVLANADNIPGINELHYTFLRGLFSDRKLDNVKIVYLSRYEFKDVTSPVRSKDGKRLTATFSTRFADQIASGRLARVEARVENNWARDFFPMVLKDPRSPGKHAVRFDYPQLPANGTAATSAARGLGFTVSKGALALEGGNVMIDDDATLFATTRILKQNRPTGKADVEAELKRTLGAKEIEWLEPLPGETTAHVDIIAKIVGPERAIVAATDGPCPSGAPPACSERAGALDTVAGKFKARGYRVTRIKNADNNGGPRVLTYSNSLLVDGTAIPQYLNPSVADDLADMDSPKVPVASIVKDCNDRTPFDGTTDLAADAVARERVRCAVEGVVKAAKRAGDDTAYLQSSLDIAKRDAEARGAYETLGFRVVQFPAATMINFGGSVHCVTTQLPK